MSLHVEAGDLDARFAGAPGHLAVARNDLAQLSNLLRSGALHADARRADDGPVDWYTGHTLLSLAITMGRFEAVKLLVDAGADVTKRAFLSENVARGAWKAQEPRELLPCHLAARSVDMSIVALIVGDSRVDLREHDSMVRTVLHHAAANGNEKVLAFILELTAKADVERRCNLNQQDKHGDSPCHIAARNQNAAILALLLAAGADVNVRNNLKQTPCHAAALNVNESIVAMLIAAKVDVNAQDAQNQTPCLLAASNPNEHVLAALRSAGANVLAIDLGGQTACHFAAANPNERVMQQLMNTIGVDCRARDRKGNTPLRVVAANGSAALMRILLAHGDDIDLNDFDVRSTTLCHRAAAAADAGALRELIRRGADFRARDTAGCVPLHSASEASIAVLFAVGADLNVLDSARQTPLIRACVRDSRRFLSLLAAGADLRATDRFGNSARSLASGRHEQLQLLGAFDGRPKPIAMIAAKQFELMRLRALEVCNALQSLSAVELCAILDNAFAPLESLVPFHRAWKIVTTVKHFKKR